MDMFIIPYFEIVTAGLSVNGPRAARTVFTTARGLDLTRKPFGVSGCIKHTSWYVFYHTTFGLLS